MQAPYSTGTPVFLLNEGIIASNYPVYGQQLVLKLRKLLGWSVY